MSPTEAYRDPVGVDVVRAVDVVERQQLDPRLVVRQDVGEPVLGAVALQLGVFTALLATHELQLLPTQTTLRASAIDMRSNRPHQRRRRPTGADLGGVTSNPPGAAFHVVIIMCVT